MGGINCGNSNGRVIKNDLYRLEYATYTKYLFKCFESFYSANTFVEEFTLLEIVDTSNALEAYRKALIAFQEAVTYLKHARCSLENCYNEIEPLFKFSRLKNGSVEQYKKFNDSFAKEVFNQEGVVTDEIKVWRSVIQSLQNGGEVDYLVFQQGELQKFETVLQSLIEEYKKLQQDIQQGVSHVSIRDIEVDVTPLTAMALTKISELTSSLTYLCLIEYSAHTSVSGKKVDVFDLLPKFGNDIAQNQKIN